MGYKKDILQYPERYEDVWPFFKRYYRPSNVSVVLVGDIDFDAALALIKAEFGSWKNPQVDPVTIPVEPAQTKAIKREVKLDKDIQTRITVANKVPAFSTKTTDSAALKLIAEIYFSVTSDFQKEYLFNKKWLDMVSAQPLETVDPFIWMIDLRLSAKGEGKEKEILAAVDKTIADIQNNPPTLEKLDATKKRFRNAALTSWYGTPDKLADKIAWYTNFESDLGVLDRIFESLDSVTPEILQEYANRVLVNKEKTTVILRGSAQ